MEFGYCFMVIIMVCIFGAITKHINESKGYDGGFAWGFFLGVIGIIVVACRSDAPKSSYVSDRVSKLEAVSSGQSLAQVSGNRGWQCDFCRRVNADYMTTCECGRTKAESMQRRIEEQNQPKTGTVEQKLGEAKSLFEKGIITEEEYELRRKKILETVN